MFSSIKSEHKTLKLPLSVLKTILNDVKRYISHIESFFFSLLEVCLDWLETLLVDEI